MFHYGTDRFCRRASEACISGLILPDVPYEESAEFRETYERYGMDLVSMVAPTSKDRVAAISRQAKGFIYIVSSLGVTGTRDSITTDLSPIVSVIRENTDTPCAVGFGISTPEQCRTMASVADGSIVGSAIVMIVAQHGRDSAGPVGEYVKSMKDAIRDL